MYKFPAIAGFFGRFSRNCRSNTFQGLKNTGPRCAPSIPLVAHGFTTTQPPLAPRRRLAWFARMRFAPHFAKPPLRGFKLQLCPSLLNDVLGSSRLGESSSPAYSHSRSAVRSVVSSTAFQPAFEAHPRASRPALSTDHSDISISISRPLAQLQRRYNVEIPRVSLPNVVLK